MSSKWKGFWVASFALVFLFQACGHDWQEAFVSKEDERKMGQDFDSLIRVKDKSVMNAGESVFVPDGEEQEALFNYYKARAKEVVNAISKDEWEGIQPSSKYTRDNFFEFKIINSKTVNAFAVPGGFVYFYTAILKNFQSESELMSVLGHEIGHVVLHHSRDRIVKQLGATAIIDALLGDGMGGTLASLGASFWLLGHSRDDELASDAKGFEYTNKIGISSEGLSDFFGRGLKDPEGKNCEADASVLDAFSTHPPSCERVKKNREKIEKSGQTLETHPRDKNFVDGKSFKQLVQDAKLSTP